MATDSRPKIRLRASMLSDVGIVRDHNEDAAYVDPDQRFFIVADGMGGHAAGEIASSMAVEAVRQALEEADEQVQDFADAPSDTGRKALAAILEQAVRDAHKAVYERGLREPDKQGMGTTLDVMLIAGLEAFVAHVGDSRTYLLRGGKMAQITTDHTVAEVLLIEGKLSPEEAQVSPLRTILVNAIGVADDVGVEMAHIRLRTGDQLLLSSDGLHDYFPSEEEIAEQLAGKPDEILTRMTDVAKDRGGHDNITGLIVQILDADEDGDRARPGDGDAVPEPVARGDTLPLGDAITPPAGEAIADQREVEAEGAEPGAEPGSSSGGEAAAEGPAPGDGEKVEADAAAPTKKRPETEPAANGTGDDRPSSPPIVAETRTKAEDDDDEYVEDDTLVGYDPESIKPPETGDGGDSDPPRAKPEPD